MSAASPVIPLVPGGGQGTELPSLLFLTVEEGPSGLAPWPDPGHPADPTPSLLRMWLPLPRFSFPLALLPSARTSPVPWTSVSAPTEPNHQPYLAGGFLLCSLAPALLAMGLRAWACMRRQCQQGPLVLPTPSVVGVGFLVAPVPLEVSLVTWLLVLKLGGLGWKAQTGPDALHLCACPQLSQTIALSPN